VLRLGSERKASRSDGRPSGRFRTVGDGSGIAPDDKFYREEVQLGLRNHGMPLEGLRYPITPTGMHYVLVHFDIPYVETTGLSLEVGGLVGNPLRLTLEDIRKRPGVTMPVTMECAGNGRALMEPRPVSQPWHTEAIGTAEWTGTPLKPLLEEAEVSAEADELLFTGLDRGVQGDIVHAYQRSLTIEEASRDEVLLVYAMNGQPLEPQHGFPLRLIVPGWYGMTSVKWLTRIEAIRGHFDGYQMTGSYRYARSADDPGEAVTLQKVRALMVPPGIPDFVTRTRLVPAGPVRLMGRAWAGRLVVTDVEVSTDGGKTWANATVGKPIGQYAWREWSYEWQAKSGEYTLCVRARDSAGNVQPDAVWNYQGMGNNMVQRVEVVVE
jgi:DMSO/TMAO reductase YedYZ molybdopterin-dependent catalytic subunit